LGTSATSDARRLAGGIASAGTGGALARPAARFSELAAARASSVAGFGLRLAGIPARVAAIGAAFRAPLAALAHLAEDLPASGAGLVVELWEEPEQASLEALVEGSFFQRWTVGDTELLASADRMLIGYRNGAFTAVLDRGSRRVAGWLAPAGRLPAPEQARPLVRLLALWHGDRGRPVVHAGMVAWRDRGALVVGGGGTGKSTTVAACACAGLAYLGDDAIAVEERPDGGFHGHSIFATALLDPVLLRRLPALARGGAAGGRAADGKCLVAMAAVAGGTIARSAPMAALVVPSLHAGAASAFAPASPAEALRALAPSTLAKRFAPDRELLSHLARLVERVPSYRLALGTDLGDAARCVRAILADAEGKPCRR